MHMHKVYTGLWRDYSQGPTTGLTLTLNNKDGALLIAFLALFIGFVGSRSWIIITRLLHHTRAKNNNRDALHYQSQVLLRNTTTEVSLISDLFCLAWAWRSKRAYVIYRVCAYIIIALAHFICFTAAGLFSSRVALQSGVKLALLQPSNCGITDPHGTGKTILYSKSPLLSALNYVDSCYNKTLGSIDCVGAAVKSINFSVNYNTSCPFEPSWRCCYPLSPEACQQTQSLGDTGKVRPRAANREWHDFYNWTQKDYNTKQAVTLDTGKVDIIKFGFNLPEENRFLYRKIATCAPLTFNASEIRLLKRRARRFLAVSVGSGSVRLLGPLSSFPQTLHQGNLTYVHDYIPSRFRSPPDAGYHVYASFTSQVWHPIPDFQRTDADSSIIWVSAEHIFYVYPENDRIFGSYECPGGFPCWPKAKLSAIGCAEQHQICDTKNSNNCSPLYKVTASPKALIDSVKLNYKQRTLARHFVSVIKRGSGLIGNIPFALGAQAIMANDVLVADESGPIPWNTGLSNNQWVLETSRWFAANLAYLQLALVEWVSKDATMLGSKASHTPQELQNLCYNQVARVYGAHQSFSALGLIITVSIGTAIIAFSFNMYTISDLFSLVFKRNRKSGRRLQARQDELLQLHRTALESNDRGEWLDGSFDIPLTKDVNEEFPHLYEELKLQRLRVTPTK